MNQKPAVRDLTQRLMRLREKLLSNLVERDIPTRLALLASLAGEHLLLIGPPGTAKSEIAQRLRLAFKDAPYFERLLTRFTVPEELFGPMSIKALEEDRYERQLQGYLPTASIAFLDEVFKANSAILNALLTLLNERAFDNGTERVKVPLICAVGASNELPKGAELEALYDRFLLRCYVGPVSEDGFSGLLSLRGLGRPAPEPSLCLTLVDLEQIRQESAKVGVPSAVQGMLKALRKYLQKQDIYVSDRRWRKIVFLLQVSAYTNGRDDVSVWDGWLLPYCTWNQPEQREVIAAWYNEWVGASEAAEPQTFVRMVEAWESRLRQERDDMSQARDEQGELLYLDENGKATQEKTGRKQKQNAQREPLYLAPPNWVSDRSNGGKGYTEYEIQQWSYRQDYYRRIDKSYFEEPSNRLMEPTKWPPLMEPTRYSQEHIDARVKQVSKLRSRVADWQKRLDKEAEALQQNIDTHLWIEPGFIEVARAKLDERLRSAKLYVERLESVEKGFSDLPKRIERALLEEVSEQSEDGDEGK